MVDRSEEENRPRKNPSSNDETKIPTQHDDLTQQGTSKLPQSDWRRTLALPMDMLSNAVNENIVAARYGIAASVVLLSAYGIAHTPLFFRFNTVRDIPASYFQSRQTIHCRLIRILDSSPEISTGPDSPHIEKPVMCLVRHLSPTGRILPRSAFDMFMKSRPSAATGKKLEDSRNELLTIEIAGVQQVPFYRTPSHTSEQPGEWFHQLANQRTRVSCQLLSRRAKRSIGAPKRHTRGALAEFQDGASPILRGDEQTAVCRLLCRPVSKQVFRSDLGELLVRYGRATIASAMHVADDSQVVVDTSTNVHDLQADTHYMQRLERAEYVAAKESRGMWADRHVRENRTDLVEEIEFEAKATLVQKLWRWFRERTS